MLSRRGTPGAGRRAAGSWGAGSVTGRRVAGPPGTGTPDEAAGRYRVTGLPRRQGARLSRWLRAGAASRRRRAARRPGYGLPGRHTGTSCERGDAGHGVPRQGIGAQGPPRRRGAGRRAGSPTGRGARGRRPVRRQRAISWGRQRPGRCDAAPGHGRPRRLTGRRVAASPGRRVARSPAPAGQARERPGHGDTRPSRRRGAGRRAGGPPGCQGGVCALRSRSNSAVWQSDCGRARTARVAGSGTGVSRG